MGEEGENKDLARCYYCHTLAPLGALSNIQSIPAPYTCVVVLHPLVMVFYIIVQLICRGWGQQYSWQPDLATAFKVAREETK